MPYLTPDEIPEDDVCRPLSIPASTDWLAIVSGALTELVKAYNWQQEGSVTVEEAVARMQQMVDDYYDGGCSTTIPGGQPLARLDELGRWRMLDGGDWVVPFGDYEIPALTARTGGTEEERRCLASKNAVNVLAELYEVVTDMAEAGVSLATFIADLAIAIGVAIVLPIGLLAGAAMVLGIFIVREFFAFADFITEDFWTEEFTDKMICILENNSTDTAGVVTFDFDGVYDDVFNSQVFDLSVQQFRLASQVMYLLRIIGEEGLNLAGETTAITDDNCDVCDCSGTSVNFATSDQGFALHAWDIYPAVGLYTTSGFGTGWHANTSGGFNQIGIEGEVAEVCGNGINVNGNLSVGGAGTKIIKVRVTTSTQVKNATFEVGGTSSWNAQVFWDEGGSLDLDEAIVEIGYRGPSGFGLRIGSFQTGDL